MNHLIMRIKVPQRIIDKCYQFADDVIGTNVTHYRRRNQYNPDVIKSQIIQGKIAEWGVYLIYKKNGYFCTKPDMRIYKGRNKSYDPDLTMVIGKGKKKELYYIHVKSQSEDSAEKYGFSWLFQKKDPLVQKPKEEDICVFCLVHNDFKVEILMEDYAANLNWAKPKLAYIQETKVAYYLGD